MRYSVLKHMKTLELDRILGMLAEQTSLADAAAAALALVPKTDIESVKTALNETSEAYGLTARYSSPSFGTLACPEEPLKRAEASGVLSIKELLDIAETLRVIRSVKAWRGECTDTGRILLDYLFDSLIPNKYLEDKLNSAIKSPEELYDNASPELYAIRRKTVAKTERVRELLEKTVRGPAAKYLRDAIITQRDGRYVVPVKSEFKGQINGIVHDTSASGSTFFIELAAVVEVNNEIRVLKQREREEIERILAELSAEAGGFAGSIISSYTALCRLDLVFAKAKLAYKMRASVPELNSDGVIYLKRARHPLINSRNVVPITVELGLDYDTLVITGPNTGGKTVTLKTIGLLTFMAMCGLMIPADDGSKIAVFSKIFADIGDEQSIEQSLSTFSSHMVNIISVTEQADESSLVLFDELCAGTDPVEGAALAKAILMRLAEKGAKIAATTHYHELKAYAIDTERVENASCEFDVASLKPTYKLRVGVPGSSNAFAISSRLGLEDDIIEAARREVTDEDMRFERVVAALEAARRATEEEHEKAKRLRIELADEKKKVLEREHMLDVKNAELMQKTRETANGIIENARLRSAMLLNELEDMKKRLNAENAASMAERARATYKKTVSELEASADPVEVRRSEGTRVEALEKGDMVFVTALGGDATVLEVKPQTKKAYVSAGAVKMWVDFEGLRFKGKKKADDTFKKTRRVSGLVSRGERNVSGEIDLRGMAADEAITELDRYIDNAVLTGLSTVTVIHGKGTGVLRKAVQTHLRSHGNIAGFRTGVFGEGENGVTIVQLKE